VAEESREGDEGIKRGPRGGRKHKKYGRDHDKKTSGPKKKRFRRRIEDKKRQRDEEARKQWAKWDALNDDQRWLLGDKDKPKLPRPKNEG
jgi:hypothetical protein